MEVILSRGRASLLKKLSLTFFRLNLCSTKIYTKSRNVSKHPKSIRTVQKGTKALKAVMEFAKGYSTLFITASATIIGTGLYVTYKDLTRYDRIMLHFAKGNILEPLTDSKHQVAYYHRHNIECELWNILKSELSNQYYFIFGEVGTGKTRIVTETVHKYMKNEGEQGSGAPVYILASQGSSFPDTFAEAVGYNFDEHISFKFLLDFLFRVGELPKRDDKTKLDRVLSAIEIAAHKYLKKYNKPAVIVIDGVNWLVEVQPGALERLQVKAKLWADTNIAKVVFISNDEETEAILQKNHSAWSRGALPLVVGDLTESEAVEFLKIYDPLIQSPEKIQDNEISGLIDRSETMPLDHIHKIISLVGGRIQHLLLCKLEWAQGKPFTMTEAHLKLKERSKFLECLQNTAQYDVIGILFQTKKKEISLKEIVGKTDRISVLQLAKNNIIKIEREETGLMVRFQSRLTEVLVEEMLEEFNHLVAAK